MEKLSNLERQSVDRTPNALTSLEREMSVLVRRSIRALWSESGEEDPLDRWTYALLIRLAEEGPMRVGEMARRFGIDKSTASRHLGRLEAEGLVEALTDVSDARSALLRVTAEGARRLAESRAARLEPLRRVFAAWEEAEQTHLARLLGRLNAELDQLDGP